MRHDVAAGAKIHTAVLYRRDRELGRHERRIEHVLIEENCCEAITLKKLLKGNPRVLESLDQRLPDFQERDVLDAQAKEAGVEVAFDLTTVEAELYREPPPTPSQRMVLGHVRFIEISTNGDSARYPILKKPPARLHDNVDIEVINASCAAGVGTKHG